MLLKLVSLLCAASLVAVTPGAVATLASGQNIFYPIDASQRGTEFANTFDALSVASGVNYPQVILQSTLSTSSYAPYSYLINGRIPFVQSLTQTVYNTLLIVTYYPPQNPTRPQYIVLPVEQMLELVYVPNKYNQPTTDASFNSSFSGFYPYFSVDPTQRASDIVDATTQLLNSSSFQRTALTQIWIQTNITGPFNPAIPNGLLKNIISISMDTNSLITIVFQPPNLYEQTIIVAPEQVGLILFIYNYNTPNA